MRRLCWTPSCCVCCWRMDDLMEKLPVDERRKSATLWGIMCMGTDAVASFDYGYVCVVGDEWSSQEGVDGGSPGFMCVEAGWTLPRIFGLAQFLPGHGK